MTKPDGKHIPIAAAATQKRYALELRRYLSRRLANKQDVHELCQEVLMRLCRVRDLNEVEKPLAFLYGVAAHVLADFQMKQKRSPVEFDSEKFAFIAEHSVHAPLVEEDVAERVIRDDVVRRALLQLSPMQRRIMRLSLSQDLNYREIGLQLGLSERTVEDHYQNAQKTLRKFQWK